MLESQQRRDLVHYRIEKAYKSFEEAKGVAKLKYWNLTGNRGFCIIPWIKMLNYTSISTKLS